MWVVSRQDTYISLRALIEYTNRKRLRDVSALTVTVDAVALPDSRTITLRNDNFALMQYIDVSRSTPLIYLHIIALCTLVE